MDVIIWKNRTQNYVLCSQQWKNKVTTIEMMEKNKRVTFKVYKTKNYLVIL